MAKDDSTWSIWILTGGVFVLVFVLWWTAPSLIGKWLGLKPAEAHDSLNTLFSGLAFAGVVCAILLQRLELQEQRKELKATTAALKDQNALMRDSNIYHVLTSVLLEYRSAEMQAALAALWDHREKHGDKFVAEYECLRKENGQLHGQRRLVSQFYALLCGLYDLKLLPPEVLYMYWRKIDLRIIPEILLPIELELERVLFSISPVAPRTIEVAPGTLWARMKKLYEDAAA